MNFETVDTLFKLSFIFTPACFIIRMKIDAKREKQFRQWLDSLPPAQREQVLQRIRHRQKLQSLQAQAARNAYLRKAYIVEMT